MGCNCCGSGKTPPIPDISQKLVIAALLWIATYLAWPEFTHWFVFDCLKQNQQEHFGIALEFFLYDTGKILLLLIAMVYIIAWLRAQLNLEKVRVWLQGKGRFTGYAMASLFGAITPFCSCSSIPLFIGFSRASIPFGTTMAFLITSPIINEVAVVILWEVLGWQLTLTYVTIGLLVGILGGLFFDAIHGERALQKHIQAIMTLDAPALENAFDPKLCAHEQHQFALSETRQIVRKVTPWVVIGVAIGAAIHGYVPEEWFMQHLSDGQWWSVPVAVASGIPLYTNVTGVVPVMQSLLAKGLPIGTTLAFTMSTVAASLPEFVMLKNVMQTKLLVIFFVYLLVIFTIVGWTLNAFGPWLLM